MKLHLPKGLRTALLTCVSGMAAIASTLSTGALAGGAFVASLAGQVQAEEEASYTYDQSGVTTKVSDVEALRGFTGDLLLKAGQLVVDDSNYLKVASFTVMDGADARFTSNYAGALTIAGDGDRSVGYGAVQLADGVTLSGGVTLNGASSILLWDKATGTISGKMDLAAGLDVNEGGGNGTLKLAGDIVGGGGITVHAGGLQIGVNESATREMQTGDITLKAGTKLTIHHAGGDVLCADDSLAALAMKGATLYVYDTASAADAVRWGSLVASGDNKIEYYYKGRLEFGVLTGSGNLQIVANGTDYAGQEHYTEISRIENYHGTISQTLTSGWDSWSNVATDALHSLIINGVHQDAKMVVSVTAPSSSLADFSKTGAGSASFAEHTAEAGFAVREGTLEVGTLHLGEGASLDLTGGSFGVSNALTTAVDVTLGAVTLGTDGYAGGMTFSGNVEFVGTVTNKVQLTLADAAISVSESSLNLLGGAGDGVSYSDGDNGYVSGTFALIRNEGSGALSFGENATEKTISVGTTPDVVLSSDGSFAYSCSSVYFINKTGSYDSDKMSGAQTIHVASGQTFAFGGADWAKGIELAGATLVMQPKGSLQSGSTVTLISTGGELSTNKISAVNSTMRSTVSGEGHLELHRYNTDDVFNIAATIEHVGDLKISNGAAVTGGSINNTGSVILDGSNLNYSYVGANVTGISLFKATLSVAAGEEVSQAITVNSASTISGAAANGTSHAGIIGGISGSADLTINSEARTPSDNGQHGNYFALTGDVNLGSSDLIIGSGVVRLGNTKDDTPSDNYSFTAGDIVVNSGATLEIYRAGGTLDTGLLLKGGTLRVQQVYADGRSNLMMGVLTVDSASTIDRNNYGYSVGFSSLTGTGDLTLSNDGKTIINGVENYSGTITLSGGSLDMTVAQGKEFAAATVSSVASGARLNILGSGTYVLGEGAIDAKASNLGAADGGWSGTVRLDGSTLAVTNLNTLGHAGSSIEFKGASGYLQQASGNGQTYVADIVLTNTEDGAALTFSDGYYGDTHIFSGDISGSGDIVRGAEKGSAQNYTFTGDVSQWTGDFKVTAANGVTTVTFKDDAKVVNADLSNSASGQTLNVVYDNADTSKGMTINSAISGTGSVEVTLRGEGAKVISSTASFSASELLVSGGSVTADAALTLTGNVKVNGGTLEVNSGLTANGVSVAAGAAIELATAAQMAIKSLELKSDAELVLGTGTLSFTASEATTLSFGTTPFSEFAPLSLADDYTTASGTTVDNTVNDYQYAVINLSGWSDDDVASLLRGDTALFSNVAKSENWADGSERVMLTFSDNSVGVYDLSLSNGSVFVSSKVVPEPTTATLSLLALAALAARRRRK